MDAPQRRLRLIMVWLGTVLYFTMYPVGIFGVAVLVPALLAAALWLATFILTWALFPGNALELNLVNHTCIFVKLFVYPVVFVTQVASSQYPCWWRRDACVPTVDVDDAAHALPMLLTVALVGIVYTAELQAQGLGKHGCFAWQQAVPNDRLQPVMKVLHHTAAVILGCLTTYVLLLDAAVSQIMVPFTVALTSTVISQFALYWLVTLAGRNRHAPPQAAVLPVAVVGRQPAAPPAPRWRWLLFGFEVIAKAWQCAVLVVVLVHANPFTGSADSKASVYVWAQLVFIAVFFLAVQVVALRRAWKVTKEW